MTVELKIYLAYVETLERCYPNGNVPPQAKALADKFYIAAINADPEALFEATKIGSTE